MTDTLLNPLETVMSDGVAGRASVAELHAAVLQSTLFVPSATEVDSEKGEFQPLILPTPRSEIGMVLAFTDRSRITPEAIQIAPHCFEVEGRRLVGTLSSNLGILIFGGPDAAVELDPAALADMRRTIFG